MNRVFVLLPIAVVLLFSPTALRAREGAALDATEGRLVAAGPEGKLLDFPLKHTDVKVEVSGALARATVTRSLAGKEPEAAVLAHRTDARGFFNLRLEPPEVVEPGVVLPRELVFVLDCAGSMSGMPVETGRKVIRRRLERLAPDDVFRVVTPRDSPG